MTPEICTLLQHEAVTSAVRKDWMKPEAAKVDAFAVLFANESVVHESKISEALLRRCGGITVEEARGWRRVRALSSSVAMESYWP
jgi:hypothetical protein